MGAFTRRLSLPGFALAVAAGLAGCREAELFQPIDRLPLEGQVWQLSYSVFDDRMPAWLGGDSVLYATVGFDSLPSSPNVLVGIPADGGVARPILPALQSRVGVQYRFVAPAVSPDGRRLAYAELWDLDLARPFPGARVTHCGIEDPTFPTLASVRLRVRDLGDTGGIEDDPVHEVVFDGHDVVLGGAPGGVNLHITRHHPFHTLFDEETTPIFRPAWSPDGRRLAFSDGLGISIWDLASGATTPVPGTEDGVLPAWSPDGAWIAFTRLERAATRVTRCNYWYLTEIIAVQERHEYAVGDRTLTLVRPDGSALRELGEGEAPSWMPNGSALFASRAGQLWRMAADGSAATAVANTDAAREPAVSPDGSRIAFSRRPAGGDYNVWVLSLDGSR